MRTVGVSAMAVVAAVAMATTHATDAAVIPISSFTGPIPQDASAIASLPAMPGAATGSPAMPAATTTGAIPILANNGMAPAIPTTTFTPTWSPSTGDIGTLQSTTLMPSPALLTRAASSSGSREQAIAAGVLAPQPIATVAASTGTTISSKPSTLLAIPTTKPPGTTGPVPRRTTASPSATTSSPSSASGSTGSSASGSASGTSNGLNGGSSDEQEMDASLSYACVCKDVRKVSLMSAADYCLLPSAVIGDKCGNAAVGEKGECPKAGAQPCQDTGHVLTNDSMCAYDKRDETYKCVASKEDLYIQKYGTKKKKSNRTSTIAPKSITSSAMALPSQTATTRWVLLAASLVVGLVAVV